MLVVLVVAIDDDDDGINDNDRQVNMKIGHANSVIGLAIICVDYDTDAI